MTLLRSVESFLRALTVYFRVFYLFGASIIFLALAAGCFWLLPQGTDIIMKSLESPYSGIVMLLSLFLWAYVLWYSGRIVAYQKNRLLNGYLTKNAPVLIFHMPRLLAYLAYTIVLLALLHSPAAWPGLSAGWMWAILVGHILLYIPAIRVMDKLGNCFSSPADFFIFCNVVVIMIIGVIFLFGSLNTVPALITAILLIQYAALFLVVNRRKLQFPIYKWMRGRLFGIVKRIMDNENQATEKILQEEALLFAIFNIISLGALACYLLCVFVLPFANLVGGFAFFLLAMGVLLGFFNLITIFSIFKRINFMLLFVLLVILSGYLFEPHNVRTFRTAREDTLNIFRERQTFEMFFVNWVRQREPEIRRLQRIDSTQPYPILFVLADGGASRSGYWTASVLSHLEQATHGRFSHHLLCLSGASGGSLGNGAFFAALQQRDSLKAGKDSLLTESREYLKSDFFTYTLARMLGPDFFRPAFPFPSVYDRGTALEYALEKAAPDSNRIRMLFGRNILPLMTSQHNPNYRLPVLCINTTRMQDGTPALVSNIRITKDVFGKRIDVLDSLPPGHDMHLSTAVVLGARFPYVSPAGRIGNSYFVDGGYFDNSGAGAVHEMILEINKWMKDTVWLKQYPDLYALNMPRSLKCYVIHITNSSLQEPAVKKVHPVVNDLVAPVQTLLGAYGTQTVVNNLRLIRYLGNTNKDTSYFPISLYREQDSLDYAMNWVISAGAITQMDKRLEQQPYLINLISWINNRFRESGSSVSSLGKEE